MDSSTIVTVVTLIIGFLSLAVQRYFDDKAAARRHDEISRTQGELRQATNRAAISSAVAADTAQKTAVDVVEKLEVIRKDVNSKSIANLDLQDRESYARGMHDAREREGGE